MFCNAKIMRETWRVLHVGGQYWRKRCEQKEKKKEFCKERKRELLLECFEEVVVTI